MSAGNPNWEEIVKGRRVCAVSGRAFAEGEQYFSAIKETNDGFARSDYAPEVWETLDKTGFVSFWRGKIPTENERKKNRLIIDTEAFYQFFLGLLPAGEGGSAWAAAAEGENAVPENASGREIFRYLLALILVRKRVLRLDEIEKSPEGEALILFDTRAKTEYRIPVHPGSEAELAAAQEELNKLLA